MTPEAPRQINEVPITAQSLLEANHKPDALLNIKQWQEAKERKNGELTLVILCSDARLSSVIIAGDNKLVASVSTIAANRETEPFKYLLNHPAIGRVLVVGHYDGQILEEKKRIEGCGGLHAREKQLETGEAAQTPFSEYIGGIESSDAITQTVEIVTKIARLAGNKSIYGVAVNHLTLEAKPVVQSGVNNEGLRVTQYPVDIFKASRERAMPLSEIPESDLTVEFYQLLEANKRIVTKLTENPEFIDNQKVQNPRAIVLSTSPIPIGLRYPEFFRETNTGFVVRLPFEKVTEDEQKEGTTVIPDEYMYEAITQLSYPIEQATKAVGGESFFDTKTLIIETKGIELSRSITQRLVEKNQFVRDWIEKKGGRIIITEVKSGETIQAQDFV